MKISTTYTWWIFHKVRCFVLILCKGIKYNIVWLSFVLYLLLSDKICFLVEFLANVLFCHIWSWKLNNNALQNSQGFQSRKLKKEIFLLWDLWNAEHRSWTLGWTGKLWPELRDCCDPTKRLSGRCKNSLKIIISLKWKTLCRAAFGDIRSGLCCKNSLR